MIIQSNNPEQMQSLQDERETFGYTMTTTNGVFDILHPGHIELLQRAKNHVENNALIVLINSDRSVKALNKGSNRPLQHSMDRAAVLMALEVVSAVIIFGQDTPCKALEIIKPDYHFKGGDYKLDDLPELPVVVRNGGEVIILPLLGDYSTSRIIDKIRCLLAGGCPIRHGGEPC